MPASPAAHPAASLGREQVGVVDAEALQTEPELLEAPGLRADRHRTVAAAVRTATTNRGSEFSHACVLWGKITRDEMTCGQPFTSTNTRADT